MLTTTKPTKTGVFQFIVLPNTGIQICRGFPVSLDSVAPLDDVWKAAEQAAKDGGQNEVLRLVRQHIACNRELEATDWIACDPNDPLKLSQWLTALRAGDSSCPPW